VWVQFPRSAARSARLQHTRGQLIDIGADGGRLESVWMHLCSLGTRGVSRRRKPCFNHGSTTASGVDLCLQQRPAKDQQRQGSLISDWGRALKQGRTDWKRCCWSSGLATDLDACSVMVRGWRKSGEQFIYSG